MSLLFNKKWQGCGTSWEGGRYGSQKKKSSRADMHTSDILQFPFTDEEPESKSD